MVFLMPTSKAVSYTHLDVYKRQGLSKEGELLIQTDGGIVEIGSGEVTVQGIY